MKKQRQGHHKSRKGPRMRVRCLGVVELAPARNSMTSFCAYYGPNGETCSETRMLATVWTMPGIPSYVYMACPLHYGMVQQQVQGFLADLLLHGLSGHVVKMHTLARDGINSSARA